MLCAIYRDTVETAPSNGAENHEFLITAKAKLRQIQLSLWTIVSLLFRPECLLILL